MTLIAGADIAILSDLEHVPFVLDVDELDHPESVLTPTEDALAPIDCEVLAARWQWGATEWAGPLTMVDAGKAQVIVADPTGRYDPANPAVVRPVVPGSPIIVMVDGTRAWSGYLTLTTHSRAHGETTLEAEDAVGILARTTYPGWAPAGTSAQVFASILTGVGWPSGLRALYGSSAAYRTAGVEPEQAWIALQRNARAELGLLWVDREGRVAMRGRGDMPDPPDDPPVIGCGGADLEELESLVDRDAIRNHVVIEPDDTHPTTEWGDPVSEAAYGRSSARGRRDELRLAIPPAE